MSWTDEQTAIEARVNTWTATPLGFENRPFRPPDSAYVRVFVRNGESLKASLGPATQLRRHVGVVMAQIIGVENAGTAELRTHATNLAALFRDVQVAISATEIITFLEPSLSTSYPSVGRPQVTLSVPFIREEHV